MIDAPHVRAALLSAARLRPTLTLTLIFTLTLTLTLILTQVLSRLVINYVELNATLARRQP